MTPSTTSRRRIYNATGGGYESGRYGDPHMESYRAFRDQTLLSILKGTFEHQKLHILEVGCGTGLSLEFLSGASASYSLFGMDSSETMLRQAAQKASTLENPPRLALADAAMLPYCAGQFDVVFATRFIHQFPHDVKQQLWREFQRVTRHGGLVILEFYARAYHWLRYFTGARKGRSHDAYFLHYPSRTEVRDVVGQPFTIYPLRLLGSRVIASTLGEAAARRAARIGAYPGGGLLLDEYFIAARNG